MSATTSGALKAHLERAGLGLPFFRDAAPQDQVLPFGVIQEAVAVVPDRDGDLGEQGPGAHSAAEEAQVTVFQEWRTTDGRAAEAYDLPDRVLRTLHGARLTTAPATVYGVRVGGRVRFPPASSAGASPNGANVVQDVFTLTIRRNLS